MTEPKVPRPVTSGQVFQYDADRRIELFDFGLSELFAYRELLASLFLRDLKGLYQQTVLGLFWRLFPPLLMTVGFSLIFAIMGRAQTPDGQPLYLVLYVGLLVWQVFSSTLFGVVSCLVNNAALIKKAYFPRLIVAFVTTVDKAVEIVLGTILLAVLLALNDQPIMRALLIVPFLFWALLLGLSIGLWLAWPNVAIRDVQQALPLAVQMLFYLSPILYPAELLPRIARQVLELNPIAAIVTAARWATLGSGSPTGLQLLISLIATASFLVVGLALFRRLEHVLADVL